MPESGSIAFSRQTESPRYEFHRFQERAGASGILQRGRRWKTNRVGASEAAKFSHGVIKQRLSESGLLFSERLPRTEVAIKGSNSSPSTSSSSTPDLTITGPQ